MTLDLTKLLVLVEWTAALNYLVFWTYLKTISHVILILSILRPSCLMFSSEYIL